jgi:hypothetical protein
MTPTQSQASSDMFSTGGPLRQFMMDYLMSLPDASKYGHLIGKKTVNMSVFAKNMSAIQAVVTEGSIKVTDPDCFVFTNFLQFTLDAVKEFRKRYADKKKEAGSMATVPVPRPKEVAKLGGYNRSKRGPVFRKSTRNVRHRSVRRRG